MTPVELNTGARRLDPVIVPQALDWPSILTAVQPVLARFKAPIYLVGGIIRDVILRRPAHDLDFVTDTQSISVARALANAFDGDFFILDDERGVGRAIINFEGTRYAIDVSRFRGPDLEADLIARDFTINAMAIAMNGSDIAETERRFNAIIDPLGGLTDLKLKRIQRCAPEAMYDDPLRAMRAVRLANTLQFMIEPQTRVDLRAVVERLPDVSMERRRDEFMRILEGPRPDAALRTLDVLGILPQLVPEVGPMHGLGQRPPHLFDVWEHTLKTVEALDIVLSIISPQRTDETAANGIYGMIVYRLDRYRPSLQAHIAQQWPNGRSHRALLILAALLHDCGKPATRTIDAKGVVHFYDHEQVGAKLALARADALRLSNEEAARLADIVRGHMRPMHLNMNTPGSAQPILALGGTGLPRRTIYRFWNATGAAGIDICILTQADYLAVYGITVQLKAWLAHLEIVAQLLEGYFFQRAELVNPPALLNGTDLMRDFDLGAGPLIGSLLRRLHEAQAVGEVQTVDQAQAFIRAALEDPALNGPSDE